MEINDLRCYQEFTTAYEWGDEESGFFSTTWPNGDYPRNAELNSRSFHKRCSDDNNIGFGLHY